MICFSLNETRAVDVVPPPLGLSMLQVNYLCLTASDTSLVSDNLCNNTSICPLHTEIGQMCAGVKYVKLSFELFSLHRVFTQMLPLVLV